MMKGTGVALVLALFSAICFGQGLEQKLRVFTWYGYVTSQDIEAVDKLLEAAGNPVRVEVISTVAEGPEQMFQVIRRGDADLTFLTLNYIKMQNEKIGKLLQPINTDSSRLGNYASVIPALKTIPMGVIDGRPYYVPFGGGAYGLWANMKLVSAADLPHRIGDLLNPRWTGKISLTDGQIQPNIALALLANRHAPFAINDLITTNRAEALALAAPGGEVQSFLGKLYGQVGAFWSTAPTFAAPLEIVASYGPEIGGLRAKGEDWQLIEFEEGNTVWLDTMNIVAGVSGAKLEAAEIFINYFLSKAVQDRVVNGLSMVAVTTDVTNPEIEANPDFFDPKMFWPPYEAAADNMMKKMSDHAKASKAAE